MHLRGWLGCDMAHKYFFGVYGFTDEQRKFDIQKNLKKYIERIYEIGLTDRSKHKKKDMKVKV